MCSIFGIITYKDSRLNNKNSIEILTKLFKLSESRGRDASGLAVCKDNKIYVLKDNIPSKRFVDSNRYLQFWQDINNTTKNNNNSFVGLGHCRMATNGSDTNLINNQPVIKDGLIAVHNGIIVNEKQILNKYMNLTKDIETDTEVFISLFEMNLHKGLSFEKSLVQSYKDIYGMTTVALISNKFNNVIISTNNGSLYYIYLENLKVFVFASEKSFLYKLQNYFKFKKYFKNNQIEHLKSNNGIIVNTEIFDLNKFNFFNNIEKETFYVSSNNKKKIIDKSEYKKAYTNINFKYNNLSLYDLPPSSELNIKRCKKCVFPETMPFIEFDSKGVCNYCNNHTSKKLKGREELEKELRPFRNKTGNHDCIVAFSGGRDSSYGLHFIIKEMKMNPLAYSYDWGVITDLGRRNQSRLCSKLGVEHILIAANIKKKLENVRKNIYAWLKKPDLGMIPIFMAGDKPFYYYPKKLRKTNNIDLSVFCSGNPYERAGFKSGFSGIKGKNWGKGNLTGMPFIEKIKLAFYYGKNFILNSSYINTSIPDTLFSFYSSYVVGDNNLYLFDYIKWDEEVINSTLLNEYDWELASDTDTTWRIGDGTAPFYNYIYFCVAGFTEFDNFRSIQVRENVLSRDEALKLIEKENRPRWDSLKWYAERVGFDLIEALKIINNIPKLYKSNK